MIGKLLGQVAETGIRIANLPAEAVDRVTDEVLGEDPDGIRLAEPGRVAGRVVRETLETVDGEDT